MFLFILKLILITFVPALELRASIPWGILSRSGVFTWGHAGLVLAVCTVANILLGWLVFGVMAPFFALLRRWPWFDRMVWPRLERTRHRLHPYVEKYGELGVAVFIGIPLPGSGVYTGAFGSYLLGLDRRKFAVANVLGVLIAAAAVGGLTLLIHFGALAPGSWLARLFIKSH